MRRTADDGGPPTSSDSHHLRRRSTVTPLPSRGNRSPSERDQSNSIHSFVDNFCLSLPQTSLFPTHTSHAPFSIPLSYANFHRCQISDCRVGVPRNAFFCSRRHSYCHCLRELSTLDDNGSVWLFLTATVPFLLLLKHLSNFKSKFYSLDF